MTKEEEDTTTGETITKDQETPVTFPTIKTPNNNNTTTDTTTNNISRTQINPKDKTPTTIDKTIK